VEAGGRAKVMRIGIISSMNFAREMQETAIKLKRLGHDPFLSGFTADFNGVESDLEIEALKLHQKNQLDAIREFWNQMQKGDAVLALNYDRHGVKNYIGGNTFLELGFAHVLNQKIFLLNPIPDIPYYKSEIEAMKPVILNGDLSRIR
jgi:hypothetical protein